MTFINKMNRYGFKQAPRGDLVLDVLEQAIYERRARGSDRLVHQSAREVPSLSIRYGLKLAQRRDLSDPHAGAPDIA